MSDARPVPLARLFATAYRELLDGLHERLSERGWNDVRPAFGFVLLAARAGPTTVTAVAALMGTTKQAASKLLASMTAAGYLDATGPGDDARQRPVALSALGHELLDAVDEIYAELEERWADVIGVTRVEAVRRDLTRILRAEHGGELPPVRPTW